MDVSFTPLGYVALAVIAIDGALPTEWVGALGQLGAAAAVIWAVKAFLARQETAAKECKEQVQAIVDANKETVAGIVAANAQSNARFAEEICNVSEKLGTLGEGIAAIVDRNRVKDGG